jgi:ATP-dependent DNA helicase RecG
VSTERTSPATQLPLFDPAEPITLRTTALLSVDVLFEHANQELLRVLKEDKRVERKPVSVMKSHELADYFSMWANTGAEGGLVAVGVSNDGQAVGCLSIELEHLNRLEQEAHNQCPDARYKVKRVPVSRDKDGEPDFVLLFRVQWNASKVVFTTRGEAFSRIGESKHRLTHSEITELQNEKGEVSVEQELCSQYVFPDDFDAGLVEDFSGSVRGNLTEPISTEQLFANRHLGKMKDGKLIPNAACVLVFAKDPRLAFAGAKIQLFRFEGDSEGVGKEWNAVKHEFVEGPIPRILQAAAAFLNGQLREFSSLGNDGVFYSAPEYPREVWYEAIVNALVHRSYGALKNMVINIKMFDSRLEIESPGGFPTGVTAENIYDTISHPRNQFLMEAMWFLNVVKSAAEGTRRMLKLMRQSDLPAPEFKQKEVGHAVVRVILRNNIKQRKLLIDSAIAASIITADVYKMLTEDERKIINHVAEYKWINTSQAVRITGRGWKSAHRLLLKLGARKILEHHHRDDIERDPQAYFSLVEPKSRTGPPRPSEL